jgi:hypothetical protein
VSGTQSARLAGRPVPAPQKVFAGFIGNIDDEALSRRLTDLAAETGVTPIVFSDALSAVKFRSSEGQTLSVIVDGSALDTPEAALRIAKSLRELNNQNLEKTFGALTRLVAITSLKELDQVHQGEFESILREIVATVQLPPATPEKFKLDYENSRAVLVDAQTAFDDLEVFLTRSAAHLGNEADAQAFADALTQEPVFWKKVFGVDTDTIRTNSSGAPDAMFFTLDNYLRDKDSERFKEAQAQNMNAMIILTPEERVSQKAQAVLRDLDDSRILEVSDKKLSTIQAAYLAKTKDVSGNFVLAATQEEVDSQSVLSDTETRSDKKAYILTIDAQQPSTKGLIQAAAILLGDWQGKGVLPKFIQNTGNRIFRFLPKAAPIELAAWMAAVKKQMQTVRASA